MCMEGSMIDNCGTWWGQGCHSVTPSRNVLSMYCFFSVSHLNGISFSSLVIMRNIGRIAFVFTLNGCKSSCRDSPIGLSCSIMCGTRVGNFRVVLTCGSLSSFLWKQNLENRQIYNTFTNIKWFVLLKTPLFFPLYLSRNWKTHKSCFFQILHRKKQGTCLVH